MKYFLCGLIILGLIAISGCAPQVEVEKPVYVAEVVPFKNWKEIILIEKDMRSNISMTFFFWSQAEDDVAKLGDTIFSKVRDNYYDLKELTSELDYDVSDKMTKMMDETIKNYESKEQLIILIRMYLFIDKVRSKK